MKHPETKIQQQVSKFLDKIGVLYNASCSGMKTSIIQAKIHKSMGSKKGFPDIFIYEPRGKFHGLSIEIKAANGKSSESQIEWQEELARRGYKAEICPKFKTDLECLNWTIKTIIEYLSGYSSSINEGNDYGNISGKGFSYGLS